MPPWSKIYAQMKENPKNARFSDLCRLAEKFGFRLRASKGSHRVYTRQGVFELLNFQNVKGMAKPYQVKQFVSIVDKYNLKLEE